jgi:signal peptidase
LRKRGRSFGHYLGIALSAVLLVVVVGVVALTVVVPRVAGGTALTVLTQSMEPKLPPGTLLVIRPQPVTQIRIGQVVTYQVAPGRPDVISHRVISRTVDQRGRVTFITKGDNNSLPDAKPVTSAQVRGVLWYSIPLIGYVNTGLGNAGWLVVVVAVGLFGYAGLMVIGAIRDSRKKARPGRHRITYAQSRQ